MTEAFDRKLKEAQGQLASGEIASEKEVERRAAGATVTDPSGRVLSSPSTRTQQTFRRNPGAVAAQRAGTATDVQTQSASFQNAPTAQPGQIDIKENINPNQVEPQGGWLTRAINRVIDFTTVRFGGITPTQEEAIVGKEQFEIDNAERQRTLVETVALATLVVPGGFGQGAINIISGAIDQVLGAKTIATTTKTITSRKTTGTAARTAFGYKNNEVTRLLSKKYVGKVIAQLKKPRYIAAAIGGIIGTYPWSEWSLTEAKEIMSLTTSSVKKLKDPALILEVKAVSEEIFNVNIWEAIGRLIPLANIATNFRAKTRALAIQKKVNDAVLDDALLQLQNPEISNDQVIKTRQAEKAALDKSQTDYWEQARKDVIDYEAAARAQGDLKSADFWAAYKEEQRILEAEEREKIATFWLEYWKLKARLQADNSPSRLTFGLL